MDLVQNRQCAFKDVLGLETCFGLISAVESAWADYLREAHLSTPGGSLRDSSPNT
jgi:hypothetical protein